MIDREFLKIFQTPEIQRKLFEIHEVETLLHKLSRRHVQAEVVGVLLLEENFPPGDGAEKHFMLVTGQCLTRQRRKFLR